MLVVSKINRKLMRKIKYEPVIEDGRVANKPTGAHPTPPLDLQYYILEENKLTEHKEPPQQKKKDTTHAGLRLVSFASFRKNFKPC
jgi:hypothetical protein